MIRSTSERFKMNIIENIKASFSKVKEDISAVKQNVTEWIVFLSQKQRETDSRLKQLETRIAFLERKYLERYEYDGRER